MIEPHLSAAFALTSAPGAYAMLVGAGMSAAADVKTAWQIQEDLIERLMRATGDGHVGGRREDHAEGPSIAGGRDDGAASGQGPREGAAASSGLSREDPFEWFRARYGVPATYEGLLAQLAPTQQERQSLLRAFFEPTPQERDAGTKVATKAHEAAARLAAQGRVRVFITTNFDRLLESALRASGVEPVVVTEPSQVAGLPPLHTLNCLVLHLHGDYLTPASMLNTVDELSAYPAPVDALLDRIFDEYGLIVAGWSAAYDPALRAAWSRCPNRRFSSFWVDPVPLKPIAAELAGRKGVLVVRDTAEQFLTQVADAVDHIEASGARHPLTVPVAVAAAKRELASGRTPVVLHDLLRRELDQLAQCAPVAATTFDTLDANAATLARRAVLEEAAKVPIALVATVAYWGAPDTDRWWLDDITRLAAPPDASGATSLLRLVQAPATMLMYAAGVAASAAQRWDLVAALFTEPRTQGFHTAALVPALHELTADATLSQPPKYLYEYLRPLLAEGVGLGGRYDESCERFEYLRLVAFNVWTQSQGHGFDVGLPHLRVRDVDRREYVPVASTWFQRLLSAQGPSESVLRAVGADMPTTVAAARQVDQRVAAFADSTATSALTGGGGMLPSGTWWPDQHGRWAST